MRNALVDEQYSIYLRGCANPVRHMDMRGCVFFALSGLVAACTGQTAPIDALGVTYQGYYSGCELRDILAALNEKSTTKKSLEDALYPLWSARNTARNIIDHRDGPDGVFGTDDDDLIDDYAELDAIPWVGPKTLDHFKTELVTSCRTDQVKRFKAATWNLKLLVDAVDDRSELYDRPVSQAIYEARLEEMAHAMRRHAPDVLVVQEIESLVVAEDLARALRQKTGLAYEVYMENSHRLDVAVFSSLPPHDVDGDGLADTKVYDRERMVKRDGRTTKFARPPLEVHFDLGNGQVLGVFALHFISQLGDNDERRELEADRIRTIAQGQIESGAISHAILLGDLNDTPTSGALDTLSSKDFVDPSHKIPAHYRWSHIYRATPSQLDYILTSDGFPFSTYIRFDHRPHRLGISDHAPLIAKFRLK